MLGLDRTVVYRKPTKQSAKDASALLSLREAHAKHPQYGYRRMGMLFGWSPERARRLMRKAGISVTTRKKRWRTATAKPEIAAPANALKAFGDHTESGAWVQDFTYLKFHGVWHYLAVVLDLKTRQVVGWQLGTRHSSELTFAAVLDALSKHPLPTILHSDQGSEYLAAKHELLCEKLEITLSVSDKASPWQNGFMESFFGKFKDDLGELNQFTDLPHLHEAVALQLHYYNHDRIHTSLRMSPAAYAASLIQNQPKQKQLALTRSVVSDRVLQILRA